MFFQKKQIVVLSRRLWPAIFLAIICGAMSGCANLIMEQKIAGEGRELSSAGVGAINLVYVEQVGGRDQLVSQSRWLSDSSREVSEYPVKLLKKYESLTLNVKIRSLSAATEIIDWYSENQESVELGQQSAIAVFQEMVSNYTSIASKKMSIDYVYGSRYYPIKHSAKSFLESGDVHLALTGAPATDARESWGAIMGLALHELYHVNLALDDRSKVNLIGLRSAGWETINEETAGNLIESCAHVAFKAELASRGLDVEPVSLEADTEWVDQLFPGLRDGIFNPDINKLRAIHPEMTAYTRIAYAVMYLMSDSGRFDFSDEQTVERFSNYCSKIQSGVPDFLNGELYPVHH